MILLVVPLGVGAAIYMEEYTNGRAAAQPLIEVNIQNLAAVPAIIYGILGLAFIVRGPIDLGFILFGLDNLDPARTADRDHRRARGDPSRLRHRSARARWRSARPSGRRSATRCSRGHPGDRHRRHPRGLAGAREAAPLLRSAQRPSSPPTRAVPFSGFTALPVRSSTGRGAAGGVPGAGCGGNHHHPGGPAADELLRDLAAQSLRAEVVGDLSGEQMTEEKRQETEPACSASAPTIPRSRRATRQAGAPTRTRSSQLRICPSPTADKRR